MKRLILLAAGLAIVLSAVAQPRGDRPGNGERPQGDLPQMKERPTVEQEAQMRTDRLAAEIPLTDKQVKKVYKYFKQDIQYRRDNFEAAGPRPDGNFPAPPSGGFPDKGKFPGGGPGGPGGMGPGGSRPSGGPGGGPGGMRPGNPPAGMPFGQEVDLDALEKYNARQDKKLRKILGDEYFEQWRARHSQELPKMPDLELKP